MGTDLRFVMPLLRYINRDENLRVNYQVLCSSLSISVQELQDTAVLVNEIEPLLFQDGEYLALYKKLDLLDPKVIYEGISQRGRFALKDVTTSTNLELIEEKDNLVTGDALVAEIQTEGRSLRGTKWHTSIGSNIMLSMAFKFPSHQHLLGFSLAIGVATVTALEFAGVKDVKLKWPNDVVYQDKKLAGILIESVPSVDGSVFAIVGVGLNVHNSKSIAKVIDRPYTTLEEMGYDFKRNDICIALINEIKYVARTFAKSGLSSFIDNWMRHDILMGRNVEVAISSHRSVVGRVAGVNRQGELILDSNVGRTAIRSGHIASIH